MQMRIEKSGGGDEPRKNKRKQKKLSPVQRLYDTCKDVFADCVPGVVPSPEKVEKLAALLDGMTQADVGLRPNMPIGIFCLPPTSVIPLHNHPGMTVFSKLLFGTMHIKAYDWLNEVDTDNSGTSVNSSAPISQLDRLHLAKLKVDSDFTAPCRTSILYPADGGNMHCFTAKTACAVLDVLGPPYCDPDGRHCQYYYEFPFSTFPVEGIVMDDEDMNGYAWLKESEKPDDLSVVGVPYIGPKIVKR
ncbi:2-aminoethanethiol dioxygenase [Phtheirospermum japonicum]|uniref:cysteine dioxygenase n=1 Tax=Phtheirospermum japonicum TaxID=374723 RepID=A0A830BU86_9LAMI|nr:2-aminoethanethiol dioxygenase [Phtheirospermum japonicum]